MNNLSSDENYNSSLNELQKKSSTVKISTEQIERVNQIYSQINQLQEYPYKEFAEHSPAWKKLCSQLTEISVEICKAQWPKTFYWYDNNEETEEYTPVYTFVRNALRYYHEKDEFGITQAPFFNYYIKILRNGVFRHYREVQIRTHRIYSIPVRHQKKLNKMFSLMYKKNMDLNLLESEEAKQLFLENKICDSREELEQILKENRDSFIYNNNNIDQMNPESRDKLLYHQVANSVQIKDEQTELRLSNYMDEISRRFYISQYKDLFDIYNDAFTKKMNLKRQNQKAQNEKVKFMREILTAYLIKEIKANNVSFSNKDYLELFTDKQFCSNKILREIIHGKEITPTSICISWGKPDNYGCRRIKNFMDFVKKNYDDVKRRKKIVV